MIINKRSLLDLALKSVQVFFKRPNKINAAFLEKINLNKNIQTKYGEILVSVCNELTNWRANTFHIKEPDTLAWIDCFDRSDVFYDIGANIGLYSLYSGRKGVQTFCFEPESQNYALLNKNLYLNKLHSVVSSYNIALSDSQAADSLNLSRFLSGAALHNFGKEEDFNKDKFEPDFKQAVCSYPLDDFIRLFKLPEPNHLKIDVDGIERLVVQGAMKTLESSAIKTVLIELNDSLDDDLEIKSILMNKGFFIVSKYNYPKTKGTRFEKVYNYVFSKNPDMKLIY
jgi:FkbM family methyltransferase